MTATVGVRDLARNSNILDGYDYVDVEDKKTHEYKGLFISPKYADEFKSYLAKKISKDKQKQLDELMGFAGILNGEIGDISSTKIKASKKTKHYE